MLALPAFARRSLNPFHALLYDEAAANKLIVRDWSFIRALIWKADIWHLHHPDTVVFPRSTLQSVIETVLFRMLLIAARWRGTRIIWTVHDLDSSDGVHPRLERWFWRYFLTRLDACICLTEAGRRLAHERFPALRRVPSFVTAHGDFSPAYPNTLSRMAARAELDVPDDVPVLLSFGLVRPYKGVPDLVDTVAELDVDEAVLIVAGRVWDASVEQDIRARSGKASNIKLHLRWIGFDETERFFNACDLVVLPYRRILNSGTAMLALAFKRPVLLPDRGTMAELQARFGDNWVRVYEGDLDVSELRSALAWARSVRTDAPDLRGLDWRTLARETRLIYDAVIDPEALSDETMATTRHRPAGIEGVLS